MKKALLVAALTLVSTSAFAAEISLSVRADWEDSMKYTNTANTDVDGNQQFWPSFARLYMNGKIGNTMDVKTGFNLRAYGLTTTTNASGGATVNDTPVMTPDTFTDHLYLEKHWGDSLTVTAGKLITMVGGYEFDQDNAGNNYMPTLAGGGGMATTVTSPDVASVPNITNESGFGVAYAINSDHKITVQVMSQTDNLSATTSTTTGATTTAENKRNNYGIDYRGNFGPVMMNASYYVGATDIQGADNRNETYADLGFKGFAVNNALEWTVEYLLNTDQGQSDQNPADSKVNTTSSGYVQVAYSFEGMYRPFIRYEMSENKVGDDDTTAPSFGSSGSFKRTAYTIGFEFKPVADENFRYHVVYEAASDKFGASGLGNDTVNWSQVVVGIKWDTDFLKN